MAGDLIDTAINHAREIGMLVVLLALAVVFVVSNGESVYTPNLGNSCWPTD